MANKIEMNVYLYFSFQTGSGKSHLMSGTRDDPGIIPCVSHNNVICNSISNTLDSPLFITYPIHSYVLYTGL